MAHALPRSPAASAITASAIIGVADPLDRLGAERLQQHRLGLGFGMPRACT